MDKADFKEVEGSEWRVERKKELKSVGFFALNSQLSTVNLVFHAFFASNASSTCPPSTISMGRFPGDMSSESELMPIW